MVESYSESYKNAGVDVVAGYKSVELIKKHVKRTNIPGVLSGLGGFGGLFELVDFKNYENPVLVSGTDGVGTKVKIAYLMDKHDTVGQDCVAMCVNDIICGGAKPLFFLDYIALGKNVPEKVASLVSGIADGCELSGCALVGGETAEMPGIYDPDEYDLAGFSVGIVDKNKIIDGTKIKDGDVLIGIASSGVHSNGFSLVRKVFDIGNKPIDNYVPELSATLGETLLTPTKIYVKPVVELAKMGIIHGISHITGGGFYENIPRMFADNKIAVVEKNSFDILPIFDVIAKTGNIPERDMFNTFNMGIGMIISAAKENADKIIDVFIKHGHKASVIGYVKNSDDKSGVEIC